MKFADNLKRIRKSKNISQEELAERVGVSRQSVSKWETSEAYPEMNNILELCKIFKCNIGELVNDKMIDLDSLGEDVKMSVVKLKKEKQKQVKVISNIISIIAKITAIVLRVVFGFLVVGMVLLPIGLKHIDIKDGHLVAKDKVIKIVEVGKTTEIRVGEHVVIGNFDDKDIENITPALEHFGVPATIGLLEGGLLFIGALIIVLINALKHLEKLFVNIKDGDTPFTMDNVDHIKKMSYLMIACIILASIGELLLNIPLKNEVNIEFNMMNIVEILFLYSMSLIFEYGYEIQKDSKGIMYEEESK